MNNSSDSNPQSSCDVIIVGGGIVGLTFACLLPATLKIAIIENQALAEKKITEQYDLRVSAINFASQKIFEEIGAWTVMQQMRVSPFRGMEVWDALGNGKITFDCFEIAVAQLGHIIENSVIQTALLQTIKKRSIELIAPMQIEKLIEHENEIILTLQNGQTLTTKLLIGADGANSWIREQANIELKKYPYHHQAIITTVRTEFPHQYIARQRFLPDGILAFLPLLDQQLCSIVWSTSPDHAHNLMQLSGENFNIRLTETFAEKLGEVKKTDRLQSFPLYMRHAKNYVKHRIALIGDAAHTIHPLAGQGVNLGILDAACLAKIIAIALSKERDIGYLDTLRRYERARRGDNLLMINLMEGFKRLFGSKAGALIQLRNSGLNLTNKSRLLKNFFMRQAIR